MVGLRGALKVLGEFQAKHASTIAMAAILLTIFMAFGVPQIRLQTDLSKELPDDIPALDLMDEMAAKFGGTDLFIIVFEVDRDAQDPDRVVDIRDPRVMWMITELEKKLKAEPEVSSVVSLASKDVFSNDYTSTAIYATVDLGAKEERIIELANTVNEDIEAVPLLPGVNILLTGTPLMRVLLMDLLVSDATLTITLSAGIILVMLLLISRPIVKGLFIFFPLVLALTWTLGTMGWLNIPLSIATVGIGAMILGLGVEYGVFIVSRYDEERRKGKSQLDTLRVVVPGVGAAIAGSATTTMVGFSALLLAAMPMIQKMGATLALGIFYCFIAAVVVNPAFLVLQERFVEEKQHA